MKLAVPRYAGSLLFGLLLASVTVLALLPQPPAAAGLGWDKLNHVIAFVALGQSARWAWPAARGWVWGCALMGYGLLLELAQGWMPPREADALDLLANALGLLLVALLRRRRAAGPIPRATPPHRPR